jgi:hypothetical protein
MSEGVVRANRAVWDLASQKHVREYNELLEEARTGEPLTACEREIRCPTPSASLRGVSSDATTSIAHALSRN